MEYKEYRELAFLCTLFDLTDKGAESINYKVVEEELKKKFPEEKDFFGILDKTAFMGSILNKGGNITITEMGIKTAQEFCESVRGIIEKRRKLT